MRKTILSIILILALPSAIMAGNRAASLKDVLGKYFLIGAAVNVPQTDGRDVKGAEVVKDNFNAIVAENCMKSEVLQPVEGKFNWEDADKLIKFGEENNLTITGHCLVWHSQAPRWFFVDSLGKPVSREVLIERLHKHISTVVSRYKGKILGWDVVNEAINDDGTYRKSPFYNIIGPEFIDLAFKFAHEADPNAQLYYNDYSMAKPGKRAAVCKLVRHLQSIGCRIDAVGMQSHNGLDFPDLKDYEASIDSFAACGVKVMFTELDLNLLPNPQYFGGADVSQNFRYDKKYNPYPNGLDKAMNRKFEDRYMEFFKIYRKHASQISRITLWGVSDKSSWLNNWPIPGRSSYPLLFDRDYKAKPVVKKIINLFK
ncbi:endo-1,4-beta-xylanase [Xylanibacter oryzae]|uniref:endo-1,4-beta-xylanase n=1 Tax=Xylanibacter oryzae TaxID=185293 RepID=UPI0004BB1140|nr:endo-1,4-beta-xylanase [Xylanibacter oryzae]